MSWMSLIRAGRIDFLGQSDCFVYTRRFQVIKIKICLKSN